MEKIRRIVISLVLASCLILGKGGFSCVVSIAGLQAERIEEKMYPHVLTSGSTEDIQKTNNYPIEIKEQEKSKTIIPIVVTNAGLLTYQIKNSTEMVHGTCISGAGITVALYTDKKCEKMLNQKVRGTLSDKEAVIVSERIQIKKKKTYYLQLSIDEEIKSANGVFSFELQLQQTSSADRKVKEKECIKAYQNGKGSTIYYKISAKKAGSIYVDLSYEEKKYGNPKVTLCNAKKKAISNVTTNDSTTENRSFFSVKKGQYYIKVSDVLGEYQLQYTHNVVKEKSGNTKKKAKPIKLGNAETKGMVMLQEKEQSYDWYKFNLKEPSKLRFEFSGSTTTNSKICLEVIPPEKDKEGKPIEFREKPIICLEGVDKTVCAKSDVWPAGTWYIKINKASSKGSGEYSLKISTLS